MKLDRNSIEWAIRSLDRHGDTDLFPKPPELRALVESLPSSADKIAALDISQHQPVAPRRFIVPKEELSYRAATQLDPLDSVIYTAIIHQFGQAIEARRRPIGESTVFSYRCAPSSDGDLYQSRDAWNKFWRHALSLSSRYPFALMVDISDFYNQIYHHTIENQLIEAKLPNQATKWVVRLLETVSAMVSRGIPVGPHAAHLLAEASLIPVDNSLAARGVPFCRFVDDIVVFTSDELTARTRLYQMADILDKQQRLQLQKGKTRILSTAEFRHHCNRMIEDRPINDLERQFLGVIEKYSKGNPYQTVYVSQLSEEELRAFKPEVVEQILGQYLASSNPDFIRLRWFLRRLAQVGHEAAVSFCLKNFNQMIPALSEICYYFVSVSTHGISLNWQAIGDELIALLDNQVVQSNEYFQMSLLSLFNRERQLDHIPRLISRYRASPPYLRREILLAAAEAGQADWLRELKEEVPSMDPWTKRAYLYAARCLPSEERKFFLRFASPNNLLEELLADWAKRP